MESLGTYAVPALNESIAVGGYDKSCLPTAESMAERPTKKRHRRFVFAIFLIIAAALGGIAWWMFSAESRSIDTYRAELEETLSHLYDEDDDDSDGLNNYFETQFTTDKSNPDTDGDGLTDYQEVALFRYDPLNSDSDGNRVVDPEEDFDGDGLTNIYELEIGTSPILADTDFDGISDSEELTLYGTDPIKNDTDTDGTSDGWEIIHEFDPLVANTSFDITEVASSSDDNLSSVSAHIALASDQAETLHVFEMAPSTQINAEMPGYISPAYNFSVFGEFDSADIEFTFNSDLIDWYFDPAIYLVDLTTQILEEQPTMVNGNKVSATVTHFSTYIVLDRNHVDTTKPFGSSSLSEYEGVDHDYDGFPDVSDQHPFIWDISDRDLALCSGIAYYDMPVCNNISALPGEQIRAINQKFFPADIEWYNLSKDDSARVSADELVGWRVVSASYNSPSGFAATTFLKDDNIIVAFRGTEGDLFSWESLVNPVNLPIDWKNNIGSYLLGLSYQDLPATHYLKSIISNYRGYHIYITGHSLGGHLAYKAVAGNLSQNATYDRVVTFNAFALDRLRDKTDLDRLDKLSTDIRAYYVAADTVALLPGTVHPGKAIVCDKEYSGGKDLLQRLNAGHWLTNFFNNLEPLSRIKKQVVTSHEAQIDTPQRETQEAARATIEITGISPSSASAGSSTTFAVTVNYSFSNTQACVINVGANTDSNPDMIVVYAQQDVTTGGSSTLQFTCSPVRRADNIFIVYADITLPGSDEALASDVYTISLSGTSYTENFSILGKWRSTGDWGVGQAQPGAIVVFSENECNLYSPRDTYALYKDGDTLRLDATGLLGGTLKCRVIVVDNDHIELHTGGNITYLQRVG